MSDATLWAELGDTWRELEAGTDSAAGLRSAIDRGTRRLRLIRWLEAVTTVTVLALFLARAGILPAPARWWWSGFVVVHVILVYGFTIVNRRGVWTPLGESTLDYLRLARLRVVRARRSAAFAAGTLVIEGGLMLALLRAPGWPPSPLVVAVALVLLGSATAALGYRGWKGRELARLDRQWQSLQSGEPPAGR
ncbi:MAG: hypothetical protein AB7L66_22460 [Gemmatimonadales bacterium]